MKKLASTISAALLVAVLAVGLAATGAAEEDSEESTVDVTVSEEVAVDVRPTDLDFSGLSPGEVQEESDDGFSAVEVENIGSQAVDRISVAGSTPEENPFGTGDATAYNAGNFVQIATATAEDGYGLSDDISTANSDFHYITRKEFHEEPAPTYIQTDLENIPTEVDGDAEEEVRVGRFRSGEVEHFYAVYHNGEGCDGSTNAEASIVVGDTPHTQDQVGTTDFTDDGEDYTVTDVTDVDGDEGDIDSSSFGLVEGLEIQVDQELTDQIDEDETRLYDALVRCSDAGVDVTHDDDQVIRTRYNPDITDESLSDDTTDEIRPVLDGDLEPGQNFPLDLRMEVPSGVASGDDIENGQLTVFVENTSE